MFSLGIFSQICSAYFGIISPLALYGCETSLTRRREHGVFENRVLRKLFGLKKDEVTGDWRRLRNEELFGVQATPHQR
jgi:hypothetical protein